PMAEETHRKDKIIPDEILQQLAELGVFGISIPEEYGGSFSDHLVMIIATEELSRASLGTGGSVLTRPEICAKALLAGGTEEQKKRWLPVIASGEKMVCVAVTEPNTGSDVANVAMTARKVEDGYLLNGEKTWATFAGRSEIICLLARTGETQSGHKGLSLFLVEKPYDRSNNDEFHFRHEQLQGGVIEGRAIPTIGYRGMHSFSIAFENYLVPKENLIGEEGRGLYLQMQGFAGGRIQTAARAIGVMEAAFRAAIDYSKSRKLFGCYLADFSLTNYKLAQMAAKIHASRQLAYSVASAMDQGGGSTEASLVKLLACRDSEWVTREAMQLHGGMGYSEEYPISQYFVDARVLPISEGAEEVLALQVITRPYLQQFLEDEHRAKQRVNSELL
ncbi:MAG: acyl-CoA/acyl-ACP dehydrogenase, partial [Ignavibacteria bacterium]|nr:acyl-CoA/acyl-ACP dehydrogenase [Ignavibacteria bacterium]